MIRPSTTVTHSAPGASATGRVTLSYMTSAFSSSPNAAITEALTSMPT